MNDDFSITGKSDFDFYGKMMFTRGATHAFNRMLAILGYPDPKEVTYDMVMKAKKIEEKILESNLKELQEVVNRFRMSEVEKKEFKKWKETKRGRK